MLALEYITRVKNDLKKISMGISLTSVQRYRLDTDTRPKRVVFMHRFLSFFFILAKATGSFLVHQSSSKPHLQIEKTPLAKRAAKVEPGVMRPQTAVHSEPSEYVARGGPY